MALILLLLVVVGVAVPATAQTVMPTPYQTFLDNAGNILPSGCIWTYTAGTTTAATTYTDAALSTANANPIIADSAGRFVAYLVAGQSYKFVYEATPCSALSHGTVLKTVDNVSTVPSSGVNVDVQGTAGEAITAGASVYLSDGSGGKNAGYWYNASSTNAYSSANALQVGIAPSAVALSATGTFRISGRVTGLSGLTAGAYAYVGATAGTLTTTAPGFARIVGAADTTTSLVVSPKAVTTTPDDVANLRLSLTSGTPVTTGDVSAATAVYVEPFRGNRVALYDGSSIWNVRTFTEITISVATCTASKPYDVFLYDNAGTVTAETLVWTNTTTRATALTTQNGVYVESGATTRRYIGSFYCNASGGQTDDTAAKRNLWNYYNRVLRPMRVLEATDTWTYTTDTYRQADNSATNQLEVLVGVAETVLEAEIYAASSNSTGNVTRSVAFGEDSTTTAMANQILVTRQNGDPAAMRVPNIASIRHYPAIGRHTYVWLERSGATGTTTWFGDNGDTTQQQSGIIGSITN